MCPDSMWKVLDGLEPIKAPKTYLEEQATMLGTKTNGRLLGIVKAFQKPSDGFGFGSERLLAYDLRAKVPALNNYEYNVLTLVHTEGAKLYPVEVIDSTTGNTYPCSDAETFVKCVEGVLSTPELKEVIQSLIAQAS